MTKAKTGPKPLYGRAMVRTTITLPETLLRFLQRDRLGVSHAIRVALIKAKREGLLK